MPDDLNEILKECAKLRGTECVMNRTYQEFMWFILAITTEEDKDLKYVKPVYDKWHYLYLNHKYVFDALGYAFLEYCKEEYGEIASENQ